MLLPAFLCKWENRGAELDEELELEAEAALHPPCPHCSGPGGWDGYDIWYRRKIIFKQFRRKKKKDCMKYTFIPKGKNRQTRTNICIMIIITL